LSDVRRRDARSASIGRPAGVALRFQIVKYSIEPKQSILARNLLSHRCCRVALSDEPEHFWPEVPLVVCSASFACDRERLTGTRTRPGFSFFRPTGDLQSEFPAADSCEEMNAAKPGNVCWYNLSD
jgi:hypothetical protein